MSLLPEHALQDIIGRGFRAFRKDYRLLDQLFRNTDVEWQADIRDFVANHLVDVCLNYPRGSAPNVPAIIILLRNATEAQAFLGDDEGLGAPEVIGYDGQLSTSVLAGAASATNLFGYGALLFGPWYVGSATTTRVTIESAEFVAGEYANDADPTTARIIAGTGAKQIRTVTANGTTWFDTDAWSVTPDATSVFELRGEAGEILGGATPPAVYDRRDETQWIEQLGHYDRNQYQLQCLGPNPPLTIALATMLKAILVFGRKRLNRQGLLNLTIGATDFTPRTDLLPDLVYVRSLNIEFVSPFEVWQALSDVGTSLTLELEADDPPVVISSTSVDVGMDGDTIGGP